MERIRTLRRVELKPRLEIDYSMPDIHVAVAEICPPFSTILEEPFVDSFELGGSYVPGESGCNFLSCNITDSLRQR